ncbi:MAG: glycosyltransferase [Bacteroidales bacterium]|nr:glycosyltransferase [Bacteroidales bacterium]
MQGDLVKKKVYSELPEIFETLKLEFPFLKLIIVGTGPAEEELKVKIPDAGFYGWKDHESLAKIYSCSDLLLLPSKFDTFSCVVLEALSCELPVVAYNTKGPKDILTHGVNGFLVRTTHGFINAIAEYLRQPEIHANLRKSALERSKEYSSTQIMDKLMIDVGLIKSDNSDYGIPAFE